ncbi:hypothetical protein [Jannaschia sp. CCS1]|uniref:hypothetical protein n=1 Tax=Jannaschia sp. (strain CCS1) TaxID=290400 RepID=UPI0002D944D7|nr:hypothetical protein [Jannaschia sp. CCS1]
MRNLFHAMLQSWKPSPKATVIPYNPRLKALGYDQNALDVAIVIERLGVARVVADILRGDGSVSAQGFLGASIPDPNNPQPDDHRGVEFFYGTDPSTYMGADAFIVYLQILNDTSPPSARARQEDMDELRAALAKAGVT